MSVEPLDSSHPDFTELAPLVANLLASAGGMERL